MLEVTRCWPLSGPNIRWLIRIREGDSDFPVNFIEVKSEFEDSGSRWIVTGPVTHARVRKRIDPILSRGKIRRLPANRASQADRDDELADVADGPTPF